MSDSTGTSSSGKEQTLADARQDMPGGDPPNDGSPLAVARCTREIDACHCSYTSAPYRDEVGPGGWIVSGYRFTRVPPEGGCGAYLFHRRIADFAESGR